MVRGNAVGIDFGTTNSVVAYGTVATADVLSGPDGEPTVPSAVNATADGALVGRTATNWATEQGYPADVVRSVKREMGEEITVATGPDGTEYVPEQVAALVIRRLQRRAEAELDGPVERAVVTVPSYFGHHQRAATRRAGEIAGLEVQRLLAEPTAACLAYGVGTAAAGPAETVLVYDLGGGTFDVSLVEISDGVFDVIATGGDTRLGGDDWDERIVEWLRTKADPDPGGDLVAMARLREAARRAKHDLTEQESTTITVPFLSGQDTLEAELTREQFELLTEDLVERTTDICEEVVSQVDWNAWTIDEVLLVGGATRMPMIREAVEEFFGQAPTAEIHPEEVVATGAAIQSAILEGGADAADRAAGRTDGSGTAGAAPAPGGAAPADAPADAGGDAPAEAGSGDVPDRPDVPEPTDDGAAEPADAVLVDVVPKSLGIEAVVDGQAGQFSRVIERNTSIPAQRTERYRTVRDDQTRIDVRVYQGEADHVADNEFLGEFALTGLPEAPAGAVIASVTFEVDEDGVLDVSVAEHRTGRSADVTIESPFERVDEEIERLRAELPALESGP